MLTLSRKPGQALRIGPSVRLVVISVTGKEVRIGIEAPREVPVWREEIASAPPVPTVAATGKAITADDLELLAKLARRLEVDAQRRSAIGDGEACERDLASAAHLLRLRQILASGASPAGDPLSVGPDQIPPPQPPPPRS